MDGNRSSLLVQRAISLNPDLEQVRINYVDCLPAPGQQQRGIIILIHGFPQTSYQFRHVITPLSRADYRVIAPDYRGAGQSSKPSSDFTKATMAKDIFTLVHERLNVTSPVHLVGHDIGGMIAHAYAVQYPLHVASITWGECPLPGTASYDKDKTLVQQFHFLFQAVPDLPVALVTGRESIYIKHFFDKISYNTGAISDADVEHYVTAYSQPGALRCAFAVYAAFEEDKAQNLRWLAEKGKSSVPALAFSGAKSRHAEEAEGMVREMYQDVEVALVEESGHYLAEENPTDFVEKVLGFVAKHTLG
ncbi:hypothetical protein M8818_000614 [Zalaria obscura]|uniref:Uncharacterized protein n=1 Tax=Zalaria obscura TaxID=2024903 RepID=A0ACC3SPQ4_9PEZI